MLQLAGELPRPVDGKELLVVLAAAVDLDLARGHDEEARRAFATVEEEVAGRHGTGVAVAGQAADLRRGERREHHLALVRRKLDCGSGHINDSVAR